MYFKGENVLQDVVFIKGPERKVSFKGKKSLSGPMG